MKLEGQVAVITGAGRGIGRAIALAYAREGAKLALAARNEEELEQGVAAVSEIGGEAVAFRTDVTSQVGTERLARRTVERFGRIDVLVNNAGTSGPIGPPAGQRHRRVGGHHQRQPDRDLPGLPRGDPGDARARRRQDHQPVRGWRGQCLEQHVCLLRQQGCGGADDRGAGPGAGGQRDHGQCPGPRVGAYEHVGEDD